MLWFCKNTRQIPKLTVCQAVSWMSEWDQYLERDFLSVLRLTALPLTNQYTCREHPHIKPVQTQICQQSRRSLGLGQDWLSFKPNVCFLFSFVHYSHNNKWFFSGIRFKLTIDRKIKPLLPSRHSGIPPDYARILINDSHWYNKYPKQARVSTVNCKLH